MFKSCSLSLASLVAALLAYLWLLACFNLYTAGWMAQWWMSHPDLLSSTTHASTSRIRHGLCTMIAALIAVSILRWSRLAGRARLALAFVMGAVASGAALPDVLPAGRDTLSMALDAISLLLAPMIAAIALMRPARTDPVSIAHSQPSD